MQWSKDGVRIRNIGNTGSTNFAGYTLSHNDVELRIVRPRKEDEGVYKCRIENTMGAKEVDSDLLVHCMLCWFFGFENLVQSPSYRTERSLLIIIVINPIRAYSKTPSHKSSFITRTCNLWDGLPSSCFPESYNLPSFKSKIDKLDLISLNS